MQARHAMIESWALRVLDRIARKEKAEDARLELKTSWPDPDKAARQLAGHANAARGSEVLWLIGVDEVSGIVGASGTEFASWWGQVIRCFDGLAPGLTELAVPIANRVVYALHFVTDRGPYVTRNPTFGQQGGGPVSWEVPWREGTAVRSASRAELLLMLAPTVRTPDIEFLNGSLSVWEDDHEDHDGKRRSHCNVTIDLYISPKAEGRVVIPFYRCSLKGGDVGGTNDMGSFTIGARPTYGSGQVAAESLTIAVTSSELIVDGPGSCVITPWCSWDSKPGWLQDCSLALDLRLWPVGASGPVALDLTAVPIAMRPNAWQLEQR